MKKSNHLDREGHMKIILGVKTLQGRLDFNIAIKDRYFTYFFNPRGVGTLFVPLGPSLHIIIDLKILNLNRIFQFNDSPC